MRRASSVTVSKGITNKTVLDIPFAQYAQEAFKEFMLTEEFSSEIRALIARQEYGAAVELCQAWIADQPDARIAYWWLGVGLSLLADFATAQSVWGLILNALPPAAVEQGWAELWAVLETSILICTQQQHYPAVLQLCQQRVNLLPEDVEFHRQLGIAWEDVGNYEQARLCYQQAIALRPDVPDAYNNLGLVCKYMGDIEGATAYYQQALALEPTFFKALSNFGLLLQEQNQLRAAASALEKAHRSQPQSVEVIGNLGFIYFSLGDAATAVHYLRQRIAFPPPSPQSHAALVFCMLYGHAASAIYEESCRWATLYAPPLPAKSFQNQPDPLRRLRVGYISPDFRQHSVAYFLEPILKQHNADQVEIFAYAQVKHPDAMTERFQRLVDHWVFVDRWSDEQLVQQIQVDQIDILVDLAGHSRDNRLIVFGRKPAPIQISYLGYAATTGLTQMDYRFTDAWADPESEVVQGPTYTETLIRLPHSFLCYQPSVHAPAVAPLPALEQGYLTFGSFNHRGKMTPEVLATWAEILKQVPTARLLLKNEALRDPLVQAECLEQFVGLGIDRDRVVCVGFLPSLADHFALYQQVDVGLDTFPYAGTTTTCEALWMGVPVITLAGTDHRSRVGVSLLTNVGLTDWITNSPTAYIQKAVDSAADFKAIAQVRANLRSQMLASPLCDSAQFVANLEQAYRQLWQNWCNAQFSRPA